MGRSRVPTARARAAPRVAFEFLSSLGKPKTGCFLDAADWRGMVRLAIDASVTVSELVTQPARRMTARREREPRSPRAAASPRRLELRMASIAATEVPAPPLSTARAVMESYGGGGPPDDSADWANRATRGVSNARPPAEDDADATTADADGRSEMTDLAEPAPAAAGSFPSSLPGDASVDGPAAFAVKAVPFADDPTVDEPNHASKLRSSIDAPPALLEFLECRICLGSAADGGGEMCAPCLCEGSVRAVHVSCLERWCRETGSVACELCTATFPARFASVGAPVRSERSERERRAADAQVRERERLTRLLQNFAAAYGRPASRPADFAIINLNAVLEAEARVRRRAASDATYTTGDDDDGTHVVVLDARGRAVTLDAARVGAGRLARVVLEGEEALDALDDEMDETAYERDAYPPGSRLGRARRAGTALARGRHARRGVGDEGGDTAFVGAQAQFRFWLRNALATLCFLLALYLVLFAVAASSPASGAHVFALRVFGFALPLVLLARVAYLYRRQRIHALAAQLDEVLVIRDFQATRDFEAMVDAEVGAPGAVPVEEVGEAGGERVRSATGAETRSHNADQNESATAGRHAPLAV